MVQRFIKAFGKSTFLILLSLSLSCAAGVKAGPIEKTGAGGRFTITTLKDRVRVEIGGKLFTQYLFRGKGIDKPILWPIVGPTGVNLVRNYPMKKGVKGEDTDHPHHAGLWFGHLPVNHENFWHHNKAHGRQVLDGLVRAGVRNNVVTIKANHKWVGAKGQIICTDRRTITMRKIGDSRVIDYDITLIASHGAVTLGDSKEGTMAIRTHPLLRISGRRRKGVIAKGKAVNSAGHRNKKLWGKKAKWVDYWAPIEGKTVGIAIFDHPENLRHPTTWHARDYGLIAANPFGLHYFKRRPKNTGQYVIANKKSLRFRYRFVFHLGDADDAQIAKQYLMWSSLGAKGSPERPALPGGLILPPMRR